MDKRLFGALLRAKVLSGMVNDDGCSDGCVNCDCEKDKLFPHFDSHEEAIQYAKRVAQLGHGSVVKILDPKSAKADKSRLIPAVMTSVDEEGDPIFLAYSEETKRLMQISTNWHAIVLD